MPSQPTPETPKPIEYATKADLDHLHKEILGEMRELRAELKSDVRELRLEIRADIAELKVEFAQLQAALLKQQVWMLVATTAVFSAVVTVAKLFP